MDKGAFTIKGGFQHNQRQNQPITIFHPLQLRHHVFNMVDIILRPVEYSAKCCSNCFRKRQQCTILSNVKRLSGMIGTKMRRNNVRSVHAKRRLCGHFAQHLRVTCKPKQLAAAQATHLRRRHQNACFHRTTMRMGTKKVQVCLVPANRLFAKSQKRCQRLGRIGGKTRFHQGQAIFLNLIKPKHPTDRFFIGTRNKGVDYTEHRYLLVFPIAHARNVFC